ncbi:hypothetical protein IAR50_004164 [Cryptococcus sp. DSM 104548]
MSAAQDFQISAPELSESLRKELETKEGAKNVRFSRFQVKETLAYLDELRPKVKDIDNFWLIALMSHENLAYHLTAKADQHALSFLQDIELKQEVEDFRAYELVFHFKENPYFTNKTISKKYSLGPDAKPVTGENIEPLYEFDEDSLVAESSTIDWKPNQDLTAQFPRKAQGEAAGNGEADDLEDGFEGDPGTFFWYFVEKKDMFNFGITLKEDILPDAFAYFDGRGEANPSDMLDSDEEEDDEEDDEDEDEIDLENEKPKKKRKVCRDGCC